MYEILRNTYLVVLCVAVLYAVFHFRRIRRAGGGLLVGVLVVTLLVEGTGLGALKLFRKNLVWLFNLYTLLIFPLYLAILSKPLAGRFQKAFPVMVGAFLVFGFLNLLFWQGLHQFNHYTLLLGACLLIVSSLLYFRSRFDNLQDDLLKSWLFYVVTGLLLYFTGTLLYFGFSSYLYQLDVAWFEKMNIILQLMNIMLYSMFGIALLCLTRRPR